MCYIVLQCVVVFCSVLQCFAVFCSVLKYVTVYCSVVDPNDEISVLEVEPRTIYQSFGIRSSLLLNALTQTHAGASSRVNAGWQT